MVHHKCDENCKGRPTNGINCFLCKGNFFLKCFGIDKSLQPKLVSADSFIKFICGKCQSKKRDSVNTQRSNDTHHDVLVDNMKLLIDKVSLITAPPFKCHRHQWLTPSKNKTYQLIIFIIWF